MEIRYKLFPYPVLSYMADDYSDSVFESDVSIEQNPGIVTIFAAINLDNKGLLKLVENGVAEYVVHIECSQTSFREIRKSSIPEISASINESRLNGKINICTFVVAKSEIADYRNESFNTDFGDLSFSIEKGGIMAIALQTNAYIDKETEEFARIPSIFVIIKKRTTEIEPAEVNLASDKIMLKLCEEEYYAYQKIVKRFDLLQASHAMLILPVLVYALDRIKENGCEHYSDNRWFRAIKMRLRDFNIELDDSDIRDVDSFRMAQFLLSMPINRALSAVSISHQEDDV